MRKLFKSILCFTILVILSFRQTSAQSNIDTIRLSLKEAEKRFIDSNLVLLAAHYNVDANNALIEQAKLWDNPVLVTDQNIYADGKFFQHGKDKTTGQPVGQYFIQVQQLIKTAGKRHKLIDLATTNAKVSELQLNDVLRNLRYQLRQDYYNLIQQIENKKIAENELVQMNRLLAAQEAQLKAGNIAEKDELRIQAVVIGLQQDLVDINKSIADTENDLKTLLQLKGKSYMLPKDSFSASASSTTVEQLFIASKHNNAYYQLQVLQTVYQQQNLVYQKSLKSPDITIGPEYDHNSNYAPHYVGLSVSLPLPLFNKNQGNIKSAGFALKQQQVITQSAETELENNVSNAFSKLMIIQNQNNAAQQLFYSKYKTMFNNMVDSYKQRQIGMLEFLDFFDAFKESQLRQIQQQLNLQLAKEEVNYYVGMDILK